MNYKDIIIKRDNESLKPGAVLGTGAAATVYEWGEGKVIKLFNHGYSIEAITREYYNALAVKDMNFGKAQVYELKHIGDTFGIVYERLEGELLLDNMLRTGNMKSGIKLMCELQRNINSNAFEGDKPTVKGTLKYWLEHSEHAGSAATCEMLRMLDTMPEGHNLCHGDFHPGNIILTDEGAKVIDYMNLCRGEVLYDYARTAFLFGYTPVPQGTKDVRQMEEIKLNLMKMYIAESGITETELGGYMSMIIAARSYETGAK